MPDKRELILDYLHTELLVSVPGIVKVYRDRGQLENIQRPCAILLDGREEMHTPSRPNPNTVVMPAAIFTLHPQIFVLVEPRDTLANDTLAQLPNPVGPELSRLRAGVLAAIAQDDTLAALCGPAGRIEYRGCDTDMQTGSTMLGEMQLHFAISYAVDPASLT